MCIGFLRRILFTEVYGNVTVMAQFYESADGSVQGAQVPFNFLLLDLHGQSDARDFLHKINTWLAYTPLGQTPNWVVGVFFVVVLLPPSPTQSTLIGGIHYSSNPNAHSWAITISSASPIASDRRPSMR